MVAGGVGVAAPGTATVTAHSPTTGAPTQFTLPQGWEGVLDHNWNRYYYRNTVTGFTQWDVPIKETDEVVKAREDGEKAVWLAEVTKEIACACAVAALAAVAAPVSDMTDEEREIVTDVVASFETGVQATSDLFSDGKVDGKFPVGSRVKIIDPGLKLFSEALKKKVEEEPGRLDKAIGTIVWLYPSPVAEGEVGTVFAHVDHETREGVTMHAVLLDGNTSLAAKRPGDKCLVFMYPDGLSAMLYKGQLCTITNPAAKYDHTEGFVETFTPRLVKEEDWASAKDVAQPNRCCRALMAIDHPSRKHPPRSKRAYPQVWLARMEDGWNGYDEPPPGKYFLIQGSGLSDVTALPEAKRPRTRPPPKPAPKKMQKKKVPLQQQRVLTGGPTVITSTDGLPPGWISALDPATNRYYYRSPLGNVTWEKPQAPPPGINPGDWSQVMDQNTFRHYWRHNKTGQVTWTNPAPGCPSEPTPVPGQGPRPVEGAAGWHQVLDPATSRYFYRNAQGHTQWQKPTQPAVPMGAMEVPAGKLPPIAKTLPPSGLAAGGMLHAQATPTPNPFSAALASSAPPDQQLEMFTANPVVPAQQEQGGLPPTQLGKPDPFATAIASAQHQAPPPGPVPGPQGVPDPFAGFHM